MRRRCIDCSTIIAAGSRCYTHQRIETQKRSRGWAWSTHVVPYILDRDHHQCRQCSLPCPHPKHHQVDHIIRKVDGGTDDPSNLRALCLVCHQRATNHARAMGRMKPQRVMR